MKKYFIIGSVLFVSLWTMAGAQDDKDMREEISFGAKAGLNYSNVWDEQGQDFEADAKLGFVAGVFLGIPIGPLFGIQPELLLSQKGFQGSGTLLGSSYSFTRTTTYIDIPLQFQLKPVESLTFLAGPQYSFLVRENNTYNFPSGSTASEKDFDNDNIRKNILGFVVGADINISHLVLSGRAGWDFQTNHGDGTSSTPRYKNQWLQVTAGFRF